jgi:hypothetical protein
MSHYAKEKPIIDRLMLELSVRSDNGHIGSGLGGNPSEFFFLVNRSVSIHHAGEKILFKEKNGALLILCPKDIKMRLLREEISKFYNQHSDKRDITFAQLADISFLKDIANSTIGVKLLIQALELSSQLKNILTDKEKILTVITEYFENESTKLKEEFSKIIKYNEPPFPEYNHEEMSFTEDGYLEEIYFRDSHAVERQMFERVMSNHPTFGGRLRSLSFRKTSIMQALHSPEDRVLIETICNMPDHIATFAMRQALGIEFIVKFDLDEMFDFPGRGYADD